MKNLSTLTNVKSLSNKSASKIKGGDATPFIDKIYTGVSYPVIDKLTILSNNSNNYTVTIK